MVGYLEQVHEKNIKLSRQTQLKTGEFWKVQEEVNQELLWSVRQCRSSGWQYHHLRDSALNKNALSEWNFLSSEVEGIQECYRSFSIKRSNLEGR